VPPRFCFSSKTRIFDFNDQRQPTATPPQHHHTTNTNTNTSTKHTQLTHPPSPNIPPLCQQLWFPCASSPSSSPHAPSQWGRTRVGAGTVARKFCVPKYAGRMVPIGMWRHVLIAVTDGVMLHRTKLKRGRKGRDGRGRMFETGWWTRKSGREEKDFVREEEISDKRRLDNLAGS
jgi:hypothetical protein